MAAKQPVNAVGYSSDQLVAGGLPDDFNGTITNPRWAPTNYDGKSPKYVLAVIADIVPDEDSGHDPFKQIWSAGDLDFFVPSKDGVKPVDLSEGDGDDHEGSYVVAVGARKQMSNASNFAFFITKLEEAGFTDHVGDPSLAALDGLKCHFNQIELPKRSGIVETEEQKKKRGGRPATTLCVTEVLGREGKGKGKGKAAPKPAPAAAAAEETETETGGDDQPLDARVHTVIVQALAEAGTSLPKTKLIGLMAKAFDGPDKGAAVKLVSDPKFLAGGSDYGYSFDAKKAEVSLG